MAIKLSEKLDSKNVPGAVRAVVANRTGSLDHQAKANVSNAEKVIQAGKIMNRIYKNEQH